MPDERGSNCVCNYCKVLTIMLNVMIIIVMAKKVIDNTDNNMESFNNNAN